MLQEEGFPGDNVDTYPEGVNLEKEMEILDEASKVESSQLKSFTKVTIDDINFSSSDEEDTAPQSPKAKATTSFPLKGFSKPVFSSPTTEESLADEDEDDEALMEQFFGSQKKSPKRKSNNKKITDRSPPTEKASDDETDKEEDKGKEEDDEDFADEEEEEEGSDEENDKPAVPKKEDNKNTVVQAEIEAVKKLEQGPTEAELRRRKLIELDEDELEEKIERFNKIGVEMITRSTGMSPTERREKLIECREYLLPHWLDEENEQYAGWIGSIATKHMRRLYGKEMDQFPFNPLDYLDQESFSDDEEDDDDGEEEEEEKDSDMISLSDSDDDDSDNNDNEEDKDEANEVQMIEEVVQESIDLTTNIKASTSLPFLSKRFPFHQLFPIATTTVTMASGFHPVVAHSSRAQLLITLRKQVQLTAKENYCLPRKIDPQELSLHLEICDKTRLLVELLKERHEIQILTQRVERNKRFQAAAGDDEEEFNEEEFELPEGQFLTDAERQQLLLKYQEDMLENEEEEEEEVEEEEVVIDQENDDENAEVIQEELDANEAFATQDERDKTFMKQFIKKDNKKVEDGNEDEEEDKWNAFRRTNVERSDEDDDKVFAEEDDMMMIDTTETNNNSKRLKKQYGKTSSQQSQLASHDVDAAGDVQEGVEAPVTEVAAVAEVVEGEVQSTSTKRNNKASAAGGGNALFRLQLEEEDRRHKKHATKKSNNFFDDEAEEEEEEGYQAGLGDFGFGITSKNKEMEDEKNALKLRKDDLDHIVDDLSDDEEEEDNEAIQRRMLMEQQDDQQHTKRVMDAVAHGYDPITLRGQKKSGYTFEQLVQQTLDTDTTTDPATGGADNKDKDAPEEEEFDEEEYIQRGMNARIEQRKKSRQVNGTTGEGEEEDDDDVYEGNEDEAEYLAQQEEELMQELLANNTNAEEQALQLQLLTQRKEQYQIELMKRKQMEKEFRIRRELKLQAKRQQQQQQQQSQQASQQQQQILLARQWSDTSNTSATSASSGNGMTMSSKTTSFSRTISTTNSNSARLTGALRDVTNTASNPSTSASSSSKNNNSLKRANTLSNDQSGKLLLPGQVAMNGGSYRGELSRWEVEEGYGMGMATAGMKRGFSAILSSNTNGNANANGNNNNGGNGGRSMKRMNTIGGGGGGGNGFVFQSTNNHNNAMHRTQTTPHTGNNTIPPSVSSSSLFNKLSSKSAGLLKPAHSSSSK